MPRFVAKPMIVEAHQNMGQPFPPEFALAVLQHRTDGMIDIATGDGTRPCKYTDWVVRGPSGQFSVMRDADFEAMFEPQLPERQKRQYNRRISEDA